MWFWLRCVCGSTKPAPIYTPTLSHTTTNHTGDAFARRARLDADVGQQGVERGEGELLAHVPLVCVHIKLVWLEIEGGDFLGERE